MMDAEVAGLVSDDFLEAAVAEDALQVGEGVEGWLRLEMAGETGAGVEAGLVVVIEKVNVGALDGQRGEDKQGADEPLGLLLVGDALPFREIAGGGIGLGGGVVTELGDPDGFARHVGVPPFAERFDILQVARQLRVLRKTPPPGGPGFELGVTVDGEDVEELGKFCHAVHGFFIIPALTGG